MLTLLRPVLRIRESKFYKTRLVPIGGDLSRVLTLYVDGRRVTPTRRSSFHVAAMR